MYPKFKVIVGDPVHKCASFSRFILPFAWKKLEFDSATDSQSYFRPATAADRVHSATVDLERKTEPDSARVRYFTPETRELLYDRASWWVLEDNKKGYVWKTLTVRSGLQGASHCYTVAIRPPSLVLFEDTAGGTATISNPLRTGYLIIEAFFPDASGATFEDVLRFNEIFRFIRQPFAKHALAKMAGLELKSIATCWHKGASSDLAPKHLYSERWLDLLNTPIKDKNDVFFKIVADAEKNALDSPVNPDDRAFVHSAVFVDSSSQAETIAKAFLINEGSPPPGTEHWVAHLNVDRPCSVGGTAGCSRFEYQWALERTYKRWLHYGTLYGFTPHSMCLLSGPAWNPKGNEPQGDPPLGVHMADMYFDATLLLLHIRVSLFRFSKDLYDLSCKATDGCADGGLSEWRGGFSAIRWQFLRFVNLYQFPMISTQQQSLEMYELQRKHMDIAELSAELDAEIRNSDDVLNQRLDIKRNDEALQLSKIAYYGLTCSILIAGLTAVVACVQTSEIVEESLPLALCSGLGFLALTIFCVANLRKKRNTPDKSP